MNLQQALTEIKSLLDRQDVIDFIASGTPCPNINSVPAFIPPPYIKSGWWMCMDSDGSWWISESKPFIFEDEDSWATAEEEAYEIKDANYYMRQIPCSRWKQTLIQIP